MARVPATMAFVTGNQDRASIHQSRFHRLAPHADDNALIWIERVAVEPLATKPNVPLERGFVDVCGAAARRRLEFVHPNGTAARGLLPVFGKRSECELRLAEKEAVKQWAEAPAAGYASESKVGFQCRLKEVELVGFERLPSITHATEKLDEAGIGWRVEIRSVENRNPFSIPCLVTRRA